jgi:hypothetical protein
MLKLSTFLFFISPILLIAQSESNFGLGANLGYRSSLGDKGFTLEYKYRNSLDCYAGISYAKFNGFGFSSGSDVFILKRRVQPFVGISYNWQSGDTFYLGGDSLDRTDFRVESNSHLIGIAGVRFLIHFDDQDVKSFLAVLPYISYRYYLKSASAIYTDGVYDIDLETRIDKRLGNGIGVGIRIIYYFDLHRQ